MCLGVVIALLVFVIGCMAKLIMDMREKIRVLSELGIETVKTLDEMSGSIKELYSLRKGDGNSEN